MLSRAAAASLRTSVRTPAPGLAAAAPRALSTSVPRWADKRGGGASSASDRGEGVDPGYTATAETVRQPPPAEAASSRAGPDTKLSSINDPFPLPFDPRLQDVNLSSEHQSDGLVDGTQEPVPLRVPGREPGKESREVKIARLVYQTRKRGTLETDLLLSTFAKRELRQLSNEEVDEFDRLLDEPDWDIFYWMTDRKPVADRWKESFKTEGRLGWRLRKHARNEDREQRFMPDL